MNTRRLLTALAALLVTTGQTLIFAADTASSGRIAAPEQAYAALDLATGRPS
jgi:hypothetical protein